ncbi:DNA topoisomerase 3-alpha [Trachymyrmex cornetzi]|uniref:DNA topoisomerase 3-alpha n=1 Tax=Trachymyrmex cornetzi TaxID=471704 RepID=A0A195EJ52_9HYME|nr:DNA topoisomerase 3-alpha [Trachymyrmex cornetzi]
MDVKEQYNGVEEIICDLMNAFENVQREIKIEMEKLKDEMRCREKDWTEEKNKLKERIKKLEVICEEYKKIKDEIRQLERTETDSEREEVECVWDNRIEMMKELLDKFERGEKSVKQEKRKKNNTRVALIPTSTPSTSQLQNTATSINTDFGRNNNNFDLIETPSTSSERRAQNQNSNIFQLNELNRPNTASGNTVSENRKNHTPSINFGDFKNFMNKSDQFASSNSHNANIMCNCKKPAVQIVGKFGPNKGRLFYKCSENVCNFLKWANEDSAKFQGNAGKKRSMVSSPDKNNDSNFSRPSTSKDNWDNPSTNVMCNCNQSARKMEVYRDGPKKGRLFYRCPNSICNFFKWADKNDNGVPENAKKPKLIRGRRKCGICGIEGKEESLKNSSFYYLFFSLESDRNFYRN